MWIAIGLIAALYCVVPVAFALGYWLTFGRHQNRRKVAEAELDEDAERHAAVLRMMRLHRASQMHVVAIEPEPLHRGDLVDLPDSPYFAGVLAVDGDTAWCRVIKTKRIADIQNEQMPIARYPVSQLRIVSRDFLIPGRN